MSDSMAAARPEPLLARPMGIDTYQEPVIYMRADCSVCRSEGFESQSRVNIAGNGRELIATLSVVHGAWLGEGEAGLSDAAWRLLGAAEPCLIDVRHPDPVESFGAVRGKLFGRTLTRAMVGVGQTLDWAHDRVFDKHCVGGLPGNRTTPLVVAIVAACELVMPKTSSRAITSPAGTADTMGVLTRVDLSLDEMRRVVEREGGCLVWGGAVDLSPADDMLIRVERVLDLDSEAQLVASVLSKKVAAGSNHVLIDIPVGPTAKVRDAQSAERLAALLGQVGSELGLQVDTLLTDGTQPVGRGIGPALEARDVLAVLRRERDAPEDLSQRAAVLAGALLERGAVCAGGEGLGYALEVLRDGRAWGKFQDICEAQGWLQEPPAAAHTAPVVAERSGRITGIDNRRLAKLAKLAGAPQDPAAGVDLLARVGDPIATGEPVLVVHAETRGELAYALEVVRRHPDMVQIDGAEAVP